MKMQKIGYYRPPINKIPTVLFLPIIIVWFGSCSKDYYPKQFPPVQSCPELPVVIYGGEEYPTVLIENRCWMAKNLNIGIMIGGSIDMTDNNVIEKYCYDNDTSNCNVFGGLYQWDEVMQYQSEEGSQGICPEGWHVSTNRDFVDLLIYHDNNGEFLMDNRDTLWKEYGQSEIFNLTGFSALPAGQKNLPSEHYPYPFVLRYYHAYFWCSKEMDDRNTICFEVPNKYGAIEGQYFDKKYGLSIRCVKDE